MTTPSQTSAAPPDDRVVVASHPFRGSAWFAVLLPLLPVLLLRIIPDLGGMTDAASTTRLLAVHAGLLGYVTYAVTLVLGGRIPAVERLFVSIDRMYRFHRWLAAVVAGLLVAHVGLMLTSVARGGEPVATLLRPDPGWRVFAGVIAFVTLAVVLALTVVGRLRHEPFLRVHRLLGVIFVIGTVHATRVPAFASQSSVLNVYLAIVMIIGLTAWVYRSGLGRTLVRRYFYEVAQVRALHPQITEMTLAPLDRSLEFSPGQLVFIGLDDEAVTRELHPFSVTSAPSENELRLVVKAIGDFTGGLRGVTPGSLARVEGPYGGFWRGGGAYRRQIWIAGGIGVTPFLSIARSINPDGYEIDFYYATEDHDAAVFLDELYAIADRHPTLRIIPIPADTMGFLSAEDVRGASGDLSRTDIFLCGPPAMMSTLTEQFSALGVARDRIHFEDFRLRPGQGARPTSPPATTQ